jgi:transcriptional regulator with XRE-family HTH domain
MDDPWSSQVEALGSFIRTQRRLANLSLRELASLANVSSAYLSQLERGMHAPSVKVLRSLSKGLEISAETLLTQAGLLDEQAADLGDDDPRSGLTERAIRLDPALTESQKETLLAVYRSYVEREPPAG